MDIKELRAEKGFSQWDLTVLTKIPQPKISLIERGYISPTASELKRLSDVLTVSPTEITFPKPKVLMEADCGGRLD